jgi:hypothetical protein
MLADHLLDSSDNPLVLVHGTSSRPTDTGKASIEHLNSTSTSP